MTSRQLRRELPEASDRGRLIPAVIGKPMNDAPCGAASLRGVLVFWVLAFRSDRRIEDFDAHGH
ncbi:MAG: hypothetical protein RLN60_01325 [Phycisphaerales bacterium]